MFNVAPGIEGLSALPLAEAVEPDLLVQNGHGIRLDVNQSRTRLDGHMSSNRLELGLALGDPDLVSEAFVDFDRIQHYPDFSLATHEGVGVRVNLLYETAVWWRLYGKRLDEATIVQTYAGVGSLLNDMKEVNGSVGNEAKGCLAEVILHGTLLRRKDPTVMPFAPSAREYCYDNLRHNHNIVVLRQQSADASPTKIPVQVSVKPQHLKGEWPVVRTTIVGLYLRAASMHPDTPDMPVAPDKRGIEKGPRLGACMRFLSDLIIREAAQEELNPAHVTFLDAMSEGMLKRFDRPSR